MYAHLAVHSMPLRHQFLPKGRLYEAYLALRSMRSFIAPLSDQLRVTLFVTKPARMVLTM